MGASWNEGYRGLEDGWLKEDDCWKEEDRSKDEDRGLDVGLEEGRGRTWENEDVPTDAVVEERESVGR